MWLIILLNGAGGLATALNNNKAAFPDKCYLQFEVIPGALHKTYAYQKNGYTNTVETLVYARFYIPFGLTIFCSQLHLF